MQSTIKALRIHEVEGADDLLHPGDFYIRDVPMYNSKQVIRAAILKCPFCSMDMMSTPAHKIIVPSFVRRFFSRFGFLSGPSVVPKLVCPYNRSHSFSITNGKIATTS